MPDLVVCVRCHENPDLVLDTIEAVRSNSDSTGTFVFAAVDGVTSLARALRKRGVITYCSPNKNGWGVGMFALLMESLAFARSKFGPTHFLSIDYDTLFLCPGVDDYVLSLITSEKIGLAGPYRASNKNWATYFYQDREVIQHFLGAIPDTFIPGEGIHGSFSLLTQAFVSALESADYFQLPRKDAKFYTRLPDDHLLTLVARLLGFDLVKVSRNKVISFCKTTISPIGKEKAGILAFHPVKDDWKGTKARRYFRKKRK